MSHWAAHLDAYEATIVALEGSAVAGGEPPVSAPWVPPARVPTSLPTAEERARFRTLQARATACAARVTEAIVDAGAELEVLRRTGVAARAYGRVDGLTGS